MSARKPKKKKSLFRRILKWSGIVFLLLIIALILTPFFFKDQLKEMALTEVNKMLKADVAVGDFDLTFISTFPDMTLVFDEVSITGQDEFEGVKLVDLKSFEAELGFWSVISMDNIEITSIKLVEPKIDVRVLENGLANYDIMKPSDEVEEPEAETEEESAFKLSLNHYEIIDGDITYVDKLSPMYAKIVKLNHVGNGDLTADVIDFETTTSMEELTYEMDGISYLSEVKTDLIMNLLMEFKEGSDKFTLKENKLSLNSLTVSFDGFYEMLKGYDNMDITLKADQTSFKDLLSLIPVFYHTGYESMIAKGNMSLSGFVKGRMDSVNMPAWDFGTSIKGASIKYPDMPASFDNIAVKAGSAFPGGDNLDKMTIDIDKFHADFIGNTIDANFYMRNPMTDPYLKSQLKANVDLSSLDQVMPMAEGEKYTGKLISDLNMEGRMSTLEKEEYEKFDASGSLELTDFHYESADLPDAVDVKNMLFEFSPQKLNLANLEGTMGKSDFKLDGDVQNYMGYIFREEALKGVFNYHSNVLDVDAFMPASEEAESEGAATTEGSESTPTTTGEEVPVLVPAKIDFVLNSTINELIYDGMDIKNVKGKIIIINEELILENLAMNTMGGSVALGGKYSTIDHSQPKMDFNYSLKEIDINTLATNFVTIEKLAPIAKYAQGRISSDFQMTGDLTSSFEPVYNTLTGDGNLFTQKVTVEGFKPLDKLAETIDMEKLKKQTFDNLRASFSFSDGLLTVKPFNVKMGNISTEVSGTTSFEQEIDYALKMNIPKEEIPGEVIKVAEKAIKQAKNIPGFKMKELPDNIPVTALVTNTVTDPKVKTNMKEKIMELAGDVKGGVKDLVDEKVDEIKDTVKQTIDKTVEEGKAELEKRKQKILADAQKEADKVKAEGKKLADQTRAEGDKNAQKLIDEAGNNPLKKKTAEVAAKKVRQEAEESAQKIEKEAQQQADKIMAEARKRADNLE